MFLEMLRGDEKERFLDLAIKAAEANGEVVEDEKRMLKAFAKELEILPRYSSSLSLSDILADFVSNSSKQTMRIVVFELIGILFADSEFDEKEKNYLNEITESFGLDKSIIAEMIDEIKQYSFLYKKICKTVIQ